MDDDLKFRTAKHGSQEQADLVLLHEMIRRATADYVTSHEDPRLAMALLMASLASYAGTLFATLMVMGDVKQQDSARGAKMASANFRQGIKVGLTRASRIAKQDGLSQ